MTDGPQDCPAHFRPAAPSPFLPVVPIPIPRPLLLGSGRLLRREWGMCTWLCALQHPGAGY
eukprot:scaffold17397_cov125-Isochrysis_galbana.AAC.3